MQLLRIWRLWGFIFSFSHDPDLGGDYDSMNLCLPSGPKWYANGAAQSLDLRPRIFLASYWSPETMLANFQIVFIAENFIHGVKEMWSCKLTILHLPYLSHLYAYMFITIFIVVNNIWYNHLFLKIGLVPSLKDFSPWLLGFIDLRSVSGKDMWSPPLSIHILVTRSKRGRGGARAQSSLRLCLPRPNFLLPNPL